MKLVQYQYTTWFSNTGQSDRFNSSEQRTEQWHSEAPRKIQELYCKEKKRTGDVEPIIRWSDGATRLRCCIMAMLKWIWLIPLWCGPPLTAPGGFLNTSKTVLCSIYAEHTRHTRTELLGRPV